MTFPMQYNSVINMPKSSQEDSRFQIDQLKKDKMIYALESIAITLIVSLLLFNLGFLNYVFPLLNKYSLIVAGALLALAVGFLIFMAIANCIRCRKIKRLEKEIAK